MDAEANDYRDAMRLERQLCFPLYAASRKVVGLYTPHLAPLGLTYTRYLVLLALWERDQVPVRELCERLMLDVGTLSPLLKRLEQDGYVTRVRSTRDERVVIVSLTDEGRALQERCRDIPARVGSCVGLTAEKAARLHALLWELLDGDEVDGDGNDIGTTEAGTKRAQGECGEGTKNESV